MPLIREKLDSGNSIRIFPRGTSMLPMLRQGIDSVVLSPLPEKLNRFDLPLYQRTNGQYVLHRIVKCGQTYTCVGDNQFILEDGLQHGQMIAMVTCFYRGDRMIQTNSVGYRLYIRFWHLSRPVRCLWRKGIGWLRRHLG